MLPETQPLGIASFGPFRLDLAVGSLEKHNVRLRVGRQQARILIELVQRASEVITREELRQTLWAGDTFVDFEHGLNAAINKLRQALGDSAERPRYIETLPGRGYRFVAAVRIEPATSPLTAEPPVLVSPVSAVPATEPSRVGRRGKLFALALFAALAMGLLVAGSLVLSRRPSPRVLRPVQFTISPPEGFGFQPSGSRQSFAISPDGTRLAFVALADDGQFRLWVRDVARLEPREVPAAKGLHTVFWSPEGDFLYFGVDRSLRRISPEPGAAPQIITDLTWRVPAIGAWLSQDRLLLSNRQVSVTVPPTGGRATPVTDRYLWPQMLPDGQHLLYLVYDSQIHRYRLRASRFGENQAEKEILETDSRVTWVNSARTPGRVYLLYVQAGSLLAQPFDAERLRVAGEPVSLANNMHVFAPTAAADFSVSRTGDLVYEPLLNRSHIAWVDRTGRELERISPDNLSVVDVRASLDGHKVAAAVYNVEKGGNEIWVYDTQSKASRVFAPGPGIVDKPVWSPDATRLLYSRGLGRGPQMYVRSLAEPEPERPLAAGDFQLATDWSRDGRWVLFQGENTTDGDFGVVDLDAQKLTWLLKTRANEMSPVFSPDHRWVAFITNESGRPEAYVQAFEEGEQPRLLEGRTRISGEGVQVLRWRGDGKEIVYLGMDGLLYSVPVRIGSRLQFDRPVALFRVPVATRAALPSAFEFDVAVDGSRFLMPVVRASAVSSLVVIQNWEWLLH
jgi:Tol biopolymer transport system component/DNA-binding winged helix-turn-helix (wHTH) protein